MVREEDKNHTWKEEKIRFGNSKAKKNIYIHVRIE